MNFNSPGRIDQKTFWGNAAPSSCHKASQAFVFSTRCLLIACLTLASLLVPFAADGFAQDQVAANELIQENDLKFIRQNQANYTRALSAGSLNQSEISLLNEMARLQVLQMSLESKRRELSDVRQRIKRDLNLLAKQPARDALLPQITKHCVTLLEDQPLPVKLNACMLLTELNQEPPNVPKQIPAVPYIGVAEPLVNILNDPEQHTAVKVIATQGLLRLCRDSSPQVSIRTNIADAMIEQLREGGVDQHDWYRRVLVKAVSYTDVLFDRTRTPYIVQTLSEILINSKEAWMVRAEAAASLGRTQMNGEINLPLISHEIARFAHDMGQQYNANPNKPHWRYCAYRVYTAYKPEEQNSMALLKRVQSAPFSQFRGEVEDAYDQVLPIVNGIMKNQVGKPQPINAQVLQDARAWLDDNPPANFTIGPNVEPLRNAG